MRRSPFVVLALALVVSILGVTSSATAIPPGDTADTGNLGMDPAAPSDGQAVRLSANFPSGPTFTVTFFKQTGPETWTSIGTDASNSYGNAYLSNYVVGGEQNLYARITSGGTGRTEVDTVTPTPAEAIQPNGPDTGNLNTDPATYAEGDTITISANFPDGNFLVTLYKETAPNVWTSVGTDQSNSQGNAYFLNFPVTGTQKLFARKNNGDRTEVDVIAPAPSLTLSVRRNCTGNNCGTN
ncbi:MAG: hypothetical protein ACRDOT_06865, partial [Aeromicrobium sp.]